MRMTAARRSLMLLWGLCLGGSALAADFVVGPELRKLEEQVRQRADQATGAAARPVPGVRAQEGDEGDLLAPRGSAPRPDRARELPQPNRLGDVAGEAGPTGTPVRPETTRGEASRQLRDRAASYPRDAAASGADTGEGEPSLLGPRGPVGSASPREERAIDNRSRARSYQQGSDSAADASAERLTSARERSRVDTSSGSADDLDLSNVGRDGIPVVPCYRSGNTAGRIGDDSLSGMVVQVTRANRLVKVRCK